MRIPFYSQGIETTRATPLSMAEQGLRQAHGFYFGLTTLPPGIGIRDVEGQGSLVPRRPGVPASSPGEWKGPCLRAHNPQRPDGLSPGSPRRPDVPGGVATVGAHCHPDDSDLERDRWGFWGLGGSW